MKKPLLLVLIVASLIGCCLVPSKSVPPAATTLGVWSGQARFLDRDLAAEYGPFAVELEIGPDGLASGTIGSASLSAALASERGDELIVEGSLEGDVFATGSLPAQGKSLAVLILSKPSDGRTSGNLHLKSNGFFDFTLRVCALELGRTER